MNSLILGFAFADDKANNRDYRDLTSGIQEVEFRILSNIKSISVAAEQLNLPHRH